MNLSPMNEMVIVEKLEAEHEAGQLYIPNAAAQAFTKAKVLAVGQGGYSNSGSRMAPTVKTGDIVLMRNDRGLELKSKGSSVWFVTERDFLAKVD